MHVICPNYEFCLSFTLRDPLFSFHSCFDYLCFELSVYQKQPPCPHKGRMSVYILPSPDPTEGFYVFVVGSLCRSNLMPKI